MTSLEISVIDYYVTQIPVTLCGPILLCNYNKVYSSK